MKLRAISEETYDANWTVDEVVQELEEYAHERVGDLGPEHEAYLVKFLGGFSPDYRAQVAQRLGMTDTSPAGMASQIVKGASIAYQTSADDDITLDDEIPNSTNNIPDEDPFAWLDTEAEPGAEMIPFDPDAVDDWMSQAPPPPKAKTQAVEPDATTYQNVPPKGQVQPGGTPDPSDLDEFDDLTRELRNYSAADMIDDPSSKPEWAQPFFYANNRLYVGENHTYHYGIRNKVKVKSQKEEAILGNIYQGGDYDDNYNNVPGSALPGVVGRVGTGFGKMNRRLAKATIIAMYSRPGATPEVMKAAVRDLVKGGYAPPDALVIVAGNLTSAQEFIGGAVQENSVESQTMEEMERNYWISKWTTDQIRQVLDSGYWPNRLRVTEEQRALLQKKFGLGGGGGVKNRWQKSMEQAGLINPGQKWWAPTSEGKKR